MFSRAEEIAEDRFLGRPQQIDGPLSSERWVGGPFPGIGIDVIVFGQGRGEFIAVRSASFRKLLGTQKYSPTRVVTITLQRGWEQSAQQSAQWGPQETLGLRLQAVIDRCCTRPTDSP